MKNINILVIEDETIVALHISSVLKRLKFNVLAIVKTAADAFKVVQENSVHIILSDIRIEGEIDGISICKSIQKLYKIPVIFLTAYKDEETLLRASNVEFTGYILKPFREDELEILLKLTVAKYNLDKSEHKISLNEYYYYDKDEKTLYYKDDEVELTKKEKQLISLLVNAKNSTVTYDVIDSTIWLDEPNSDTNRRQLLYRVKNKLPSLEIESITGVGVCLKV